MRDDHRLIPAFHATPIPRTHTERERERERERGVLCFHCSMDHASSSSSSSSPPPPPPPPASSSSSAAGMAERKDGEDGVEAAPRLEEMARRYQLEVLEIAKNQNTIVYLETGCGKTLIAVLLLQGFTNLVRSPQKGVSVFLVPTRNLVCQQANVIKSLTDLKVGQFSGTNNADVWNYRKWEYEVEKHEVFVMTPQIMLNNLYHSLMKMETIKLLIFDECHHCQKEHPYACIMREFYHELDVQKRPRIFGMTASPVIGRGGYSEDKYGSIIQMLESILDSKIYTIRNREELESVVVTPNLIKKEYGPTVYGDKRLTSCMQIINDLVVKHSGLEYCESNQEDAIDVPFENKKKNFLEEIQRTLHYCLYELGIWCSKYAAELMLQEGKDFELESLPAFDKDCFLQEVISSLCQLCGKGSDNYMEMLDPPLISNKVFALVEVLSEYRQQKLKCIVFVERIIAARVLSGILVHFQCLQSLRCKFLFGCQRSSKGVSKRYMEQTLEEFRSGQVDLLVATNVAEEGLDIQSCSLVVRFDLPKTIRSFIQSRGRARKRGSKYIVLLERGNNIHEEILNDLVVSEYLMQERVKANSSLPLESELVVQQSNEKFEVKSTGATIPLNHSIALLHHFCSVLPRDEFFIPIPKFSITSVVDGFQCEITLPVNAPIRKVVGLPCSSTDMSKKAACLEACKLLYEVGALTDYLLPWKYMMEDFPSPEWEQSDATLDSKPELYESVVPRILLRQIDTSDYTSVYAYSLRFCPCPCDRGYADFGLFLESSLPDYAASLTVELHLGNGRTVISQLIPSGKLVFSESQVTEAENFQSLLLSIMLEHQLKVCDGINALSFNTFSEHTRWYLLLPTVKKIDKIGNQLEVDWRTIKLVVDSLSLPRESIIEEGKFSDDRSVLHMANIKIPSQDLPGALVRTIHNDKLYSIVDVLYGTCALSKFSDSSFSNYLDYFRLSQNYLLVYTNQPMLKAKALKRVHNLLFAGSLDENGVASSGAGCSNPKEECLVELPPEVCHIELLGVSTSILNSVTLLPSFMHRLEKILVASQLKDVFSAGFQEGCQVSPYRIFEALTTADCQENLSLERLELLGDSFLKFSVSCHLFLKYDKKDEGFLSERRKLAICNLTLYKLGVKHDIPGYIHSSIFDPTEWVAPGRPCRIICDADHVLQIHGSHIQTKQKDRRNVVCSKGHRWIHRKTIADTIEALIGAYLVDGGQNSALSFMKWIGLDVDFHPSLAYSIGNRSLSNPVLFKKYQLKNIEELMGYEFSYDGLLLEAFTHASYGYASACYQRLEFLGDAVLDYPITQFLYTNFKKLTPGQLTDLRCAIVSNENFARVAVRHHLEQHLLENSTILRRKIQKFVTSISNASKEDNKMPDELVAEMCPKVLADILESLAGAIFVDTGFNVNKFWDVFERLFHPIISVESLQLNPIRELVELCQKYHFTLDFNSKKVCNGYLMEVNIITTDTAINGIAKAEHKMLARRMAADNALQKLKLMGLQHSHHSIIEYFKLDLSRINENSAESCTVEPRSVKETVACGQDTSPVLCSSSFSSLASSCCNVAADNAKHIVSCSSVSTAYSTNVGEAHTHKPHTSIPSSNQKRENTGLVNAGHSFPERAVSEGVNSGEARISALVCSQEGDTTQSISSQKNFSMSAHPPCPNSLVTNSNSATKSLKQNCKGKSDLELVNSVGQLVRPTRQNEDFEEKLLSADSESVLVLTEMIKSQFSPFSSQQSSMNAEDNSTTSATTVTFTQGKPRSQLYEICAKNKWADPLFTCINEGGLPHNKLFTYIVELTLPGIGAVRNQGKPMKTAKSAMDTAAVESLSWLRGLHYI